jgi:hypothetical protein
MSRTCRRRLRTILTLLVMTALLCSQTVLAQHAICLAASVPSSAADSAHAGDCHADSSSVESVICDTHCSQGDLSSHESARGLFVPVLGPVPFAAELPAQGVRQDVLDLGRVFRSSWHRPTLHPAQVLLI